MQPERLQNLCSDVILKNLKTFHRLEELKPLIGPRLVDRLFLTDIDLQRHFFDPKKRSSTRLLRRKLLNTFKFDIIFEKRYSYWLMRWWSPRIPFLRTVILKMVFSVRERREFSPTDELKGSYLCTDFYDVCLRCMTQIIQLNNLDVGEVKRHFTLSFNSNNNTLLPKNLDYCSKCLQVPLYCLFTYEFFETIFGRVCNHLLCRRHAEICEEFRYKCRYIQKSKIWEEFRYIECRYIQKFINCQTIKSSHDDFIINGIPFLKEKLYGRCTCCPVSLAISSHNGMFYFKT